MRSVPTVGALLLFVAACGTGEGGDTTATLIETPATGVSSSSTSDTTTTAPETTTTTEATTTTTELAGNWAEEPLVTTQFGALGWWDGANWVQATEFTPLPVSGGEDYQVALFGVEATLTAGPEAVLCEPVFNPGVELSDPGMLGEWPGPIGVAISSPWSLTPHLVQSETDDGTYSDFARPLLAERGLEVPNPVIKQVIRADFEGDGVNEVIVVAEDISDPSLFAEEGDYSLAFLRKVVDGEVQTAILGESVIVDVAEGETPFVESFEVGAVADLNGDEKMEIVMDAVYYEGLGVVVYEYVNDDLGPVAQISMGCGS